MPKAALVTSSETQSLICLWKDQVAIFEVFIHSISRLDRLIIFLHRLGTRLSGFINSLQFILTRIIFYSHFHRRWGPGSEPCGSTVALSSIRRPWTYQLQRLNDRFHRDRRGRKGGGGKSGRIRQRRSRPIGDGAMTPLRRGAGV